jgi:hypothetical protein
LLALLAVLRLRSVRRVLHALGRTRHGSLRRVGRIRNVIVTPAVLIDLWIGAIYVAVNDLVIGAGTIVSAG